MTAARKLVLVICSLAVVAACLWVPWRERPYGTYSIDRGYALLWEPPRAINNPRISVAEMDGRRVVLELTAILAVAFVLLLLLPTRKCPPKPPGPP